MLVTYIMLHYIVYVTVHIFTIPYITLKFRRIRNFLFAKSFIFLKREGLIFCNNSLVNDYGSKNLVTVYFTHMLAKQKKGLKEYICLLALCPEPNIWFKKNILVNLTGIAQSGIFSYTGILFTNLALSVLPPPPPASHTPPPRLPTSPPLRESVGPPLSPVLPTDGGGVGGGDIDNGTRF